MPVKPVTHPTAEELSAYGLGQLNESRTAAVARHLQSCPQCRQAVSRVSPDSFAGQVPAARPAGSGTQLPAAPLGASPARPAAPKDQAPELPPDLANHAKFRILKELGRGGMGVVYQAEHRIMDRTVALKVINKTLLNNADALERFQREVRAAARLDHEHIVRALDADCAGDLRLLIMEFVEGVSLEKELEQKGPLPVAHACHYTRQAALGLQHAHEKGMVHRDIKPQNLMLTPRKVVKILDFGLASMASEQKAGSGLTRSGDFMGTPEYVAPEQATDASTADIRADIYSLGCTLYCLLTGRPPFQEAQAIQTILAHLQREPTPLPQLRSDLPAELWPVVARMLAKDPAQRLPDSARGRRCSGAVLQDGRKDRLPFVRSVSPAGRTPGPANRPARRLAARGRRSGRGLPRRPTSKRPQRTLRPNRLRDWTRPGRAGRARGRQSRRPPQRPGAGRCWPAQRPGFSCSCCWPDSSCGPGPDKEMEGLPRRLRSRRRTSRWLWLSSQSLTRSLARPNPGRSRAKRSQPSRGSTREAPRRTRATAIPNQSRHRRTQSRPAPRQLLPTRRKSLHQPR